MTRPANVSGLVYRCTHCDAVFPPASTTYVPIPGRAIELGYQRALSAIVDANITTFITAVVLFLVGAGPVRGFAITLGIGIITSVFTAIYVTRVFIEIWYRSRRPATVVV